MKYQMKQKIFSWGDDFTIKDESGDVAFLVDGKVFSWGDKLSFQTPDGRELARVEQQLLSWGPTYHVYRSDNKVATVRKKIFTFLGSKYNIDDEGSSDLEVEGDFWAHEYAITRDGRPVAQISKAFFSWGDTYGIDIVDGEDDVLLLAVAVTIDMVQHDDKHNH